MSRLVKCFLLKAANSMDISWSLLTTLYPGILHLFTHLTLGADWIHVQWLNKIYWLWEHTLTLRHLVDNFLIHLFVFPYYLKPQIYILPCGGCNGDLIKWSVGVSVGCVTAWTVLPRLELNLVADRLTHIPTVRQHWANKDWHSIDIEKYSGRIRKDTILFLRLISSQDTEMDANWEQNGWKLEIILI